MTRSKFPFEPTAYQVLGVDASASETEVRRAYRKAARKKHPDAGGSAEDFDLLSRAWELVRDTQSRAEYDEQLRATQPPNTRSKARADNAQSSPRRYQGSTRSEQAAQKPVLDIYPPLSEGPLEVVTENSRGKSVSVLIDARRTSQRIIGEQKLPSAFAAVEDELIQRLIPSLPALRVFHGLRIKTGRLSTQRVPTLFVAGQRAAIIEYLRVPADSYRFTGSELQGNKRLRLPDITEPLVTLSTTFPGLHVGGFLVATSADGNLHAPEIAAPLNLTGSLGYSAAPASLFDAVRELKFFFGTGETPHRVDRELLGALLAKTPEGK